MIMTIVELEAYYRKMADDYEREATDLRKRGQMHETNKDYDKAIPLYTLSAENYEKSRLCSQFVTELLKFEILDK